MKQTQLFTKTRKEVPSDEVSKNAQLLIRAGYMHKEMAGVYSYLPLGWRVFQKVTDIIRSEMNKMGGNELHLSTLQESGKWKKTNRWDDEVVDNWFKSSTHGDLEVGFAFTHEEPLTTIMRDHISSYKDLPRYAYQIQNKFRYEARAKSGILRGREFYMKDLYSFSRDKEEHGVFYEQMKDAYMRIYEQIGIGEQTFVTVSNGGTFSKYSYEFQTVCDAGEDTIYIDEEKQIAINGDDWNKETLADFGFETDKTKLREEKSVEVGDIYSLGTKFSDALGLTYKNENGENVPVIMGSYGIGISRLIGTIIEVFADDKGIVWPESVAPYTIHLVGLNGDDAEIKDYADGVYTGLQARGIEVLYDDRAVRPGEKFADSDLLGIPYRVVASKKTKEEGKFEVVERKTGEVRYLSEGELFADFAKDKTKEA